MTLIVLKLGGSVLVDLASYGRCARLLRDRLREEAETRFVVVVSAQFGETDALLALARSVAGEPDPATLDLLWSTGEIKSAATLALSLQALGVRAVALDVHQTGIRRLGDLDVDPLPLRRALSCHDVVVVPGFLAADRESSVVSLGRGGSDLTAVAVAAALDADRCELLKDVPGYFASDPNRDAGAAHIASIDYERALEMANDGCDLVQAAALERAQHAGLVLVIGAANDPRQTLVRGQTGVRTGSERGQNGVGVAMRGDSTNRDGWIAGAAAARENCLSTKDNFQR
jgi:aspartate kinase